MAELSEKARKVRSEYMKEYRRRNKDKYNESKREWQRRNKDKVREYQRKYWERIAKEHEEAEKEGASS